MNSQKTPAKPKSVTKPMQVETAEVDPAFDDAITKNRACPLPPPASVPSPPKGYRPTAAVTRSRRLRKLADELRAETLVALGELTTHGPGVKDDLGRYAPEPAHIVNVRERLTTSGQLVAAAETLLGFANEMDQIARSDAVQILESVHKLLQTALPHNPKLAERYRGVTEIFGAVGAAIAKGRARAKKARVVTTP